MKRDQIENREATGRSLFALAFGESWFDRRRDTLLRLLNGLTLLLALVAVASVVARRGFVLDSTQARWAGWASIAVLYAFVAQAFLKLALARDRGAHLRERWGELTVFVLILLHLLFPQPLRGVLLSINPLLSAQTITSIYLVVTQGLVLVALIPSAARYSNRLMAKNVQPATLILLGFLSLIAVGTGLLCLPRATVAGSMPVLDALFTATSAVCVTGLIVVDTATYFTPTGQLILLLLIQVGGLGIMTLTTFFAYVAGGKSRLKEYSAMQTLLGEENLGKIRATILRIALMTFCIEAIGALVIYHELVAEAGTRRWMFAVFHSISAFCNAGFALTTENLAVASLSSNLKFLCTIMLLIVVGGLGFPVLSNLSEWTLQRRRRGPRARLTVHTRLVLSATAVLLVLGTLFFALLEANGVLAGMSTGQRLLASCFHSVSARTAGFNTIDVGALAAPTMFFLCLLMWVGASPGSTGGGIKTTSFALALLNIWAIARGRNRVEVFRRHVDEVAVVKAFSTVLLSGLAISTAFFILLCSESARFDALLFEVVSAVGTVGLSTGITATLSPLGKCVIIVSMIAGRVGFLALVMALIPRQREVSYDFTTENVLVT